MRARFVDSEQVSQRLRLLEVGVGVVGVDVERDLKRIECRIQFPEFPVQAPDLNPRLQVLSVILNRSIVALQCTGCITLPVKAFCQMKVRLGIVRVGQEGTVETPRLHRRDGLRRNAGIPD